MDSKMMVIATVFSILFLSYTPLAHSGERPVATRASQRGYQCRLCGKPYTRYHHLVRHYNAQHTNKRLLCSICNKQFSDPSVLRRHKRIHSGLRAYQCRLCPSNYGRKDHLTRHMQKKHPKELSNPNQNPSIGQVPAAPAGASLQTALPNPLLQAANQVPLPSRQAPDTHSSASSVLPADSLYIALLELAHRGTAQEPQPSACQVPPALVLSTTQALYAPALYAPAAPAPAQALSHSPAHQALGVLPPPVREEGSTPSFVPSHSPQILSRTPSGT